MLLEHLLDELKNEGCFPCVSYRGGGIWRAHVNGAGNFWYDASSPVTALNKAIREWRAAGKPMDGYAALKRKA